MASVKKLRDSLLTHKVVRGHLSYNGCIKTESQKEGRMGSPIPRTLTVSAQTAPRYPAHTLGEASLTFTVPNSPSICRITGTLVTYLKVSS